MQHKIDGYIDFIRINNISLCSEKNPLAEAKNWHDYVCKHFASSNFIVGLGCGFHVAHCAYENPDKNFYVVDFHSELKELFYRKYTTQFKNVGIIILNRPDEILENPSLTMNTGRPLKSFIFRPACLHNVDQYISLQDHITGRSYIGLKKLVDSQMIKLDFVPEKQGPLSIADIINTHPRHDLYLKLLAELVK